MSRLTPSQRLATESPGNVLVVAGAGAGKTRTLVDRCLARVLAQDDPVPLDRVLMVTFTEAAAAEMRSRIRERLQEELDSHPEDTWLAEQLALVDSAWICTLHAFCLRLVREHFHELGLDPQLLVLEEMHSEVLAAETLEQLLQARYSGATTEDEAVRQLILVYGQGRDDPVRSLVRRIHDYTQTLPDPEGWHREHIFSPDHAGAARWLEFLLEALEEWPKEWIEVLEDLSEEQDSPNAHACLQILRNWPSQPTREQAAEAVRAILGQDTGWPTRRKTVCRKPLARLFEDARFLDSVLEGHNEPRQGPSADPIEEDWLWVRPLMAALLQLTRDFAARFSEAKRERAAVDFHDLEQFALRLLWDSQARRPTAIASIWRERLRYVLVDEYQDINAAQDCILQALSRTEPVPNRFLVGDVKQSIYRFRLARPQIFQAYARTWKEAGPQGRLVSLSENFRSHEAILQFINLVFANLMRYEVGGVDYTPETWLQAGSCARSVIWKSIECGVRVELLLCLKTKAASEEPEDEEDEGSPAPEGEDRSNTEREAAMIAERLQQLRREQFKVWDESSQTLRPVTWSDMIILLRSPRYKTEAYAKTFNRYGVPLVLSRRGLYEATEVTDLLSLLQLLDNPLQDLPLLAVLRSPLAGLTVDELAIIRLDQRDGLFWHAVQQFHTSGPVEAAVRDPSAAAVRARAWQKVDSFLASYGCWRRLARQNALSQCLESILDETHFEAWLLSQDRGEQRCANVRRLLSITRQFDQFQRQGLFRFLTAIEAQQEVDFDPEPASVDAGDAVRLMSIHQSKGLEFPVVVLADLGKRFNTLDLRNHVILDDHYGICPLVRPPNSPHAYPSVPHWLAARQQRCESLGEEIRLLYVAATRACDKLILSGTVSMSELDSKWQAGLEGPLHIRQLRAADTCLHWLGPVLTRMCGRAGWFAEPSGRCATFEWRIVRAEQAGTSPGTGAPSDSGAPSSAPLPPGSIEQLDHRLRWIYPHRAASLETAKCSVTALRRRVVETPDEETQQLFPAAEGRPPAFATAASKGRRSPGRATRGAGLSPAEVGLIHHRFLQRLALDGNLDLRGLEDEVERFQSEGILAPEEAQALDLKACAAFWTSDLGRRIQANAACVRRELEFTARFAATDLAAAGVPVSGNLAAEEYVVVQGVADLVVVRPAEVWLVDFKTDHLRREDLSARVAAYTPQLALYAIALDRMFRRPVTEKWLCFLALGSHLNI